MHRIFSEDLNENIVSNVITDGGKVFLSHGLEGSGGLKADDSAPKWVTLPNVFFEAVQASEHSQYMDHILFVGQLVAMVASSAILVVAKLQPGVAPWMIVSTGVALLMLYLRHYADFSRSSFAAMAVAESVKSLCWKYMTRANPFSSMEDESKMEEMFVYHLRRIVDVAGNSIKWKRPIIDSPLDEVSGLRALRRASAENRLEVYVKQRLLLEKNSYLRDARRYDLGAKITFAFIATLHIVSVAAAINYAGDPLRNLNIAGIVIAMSLAYMGWAESTNQRSQAEALRLAATEIDLLLEQLVLMRSDEDVAAFIADAETALDREHSLWIARRQSVPLILKS